VDTDGDGIPDFRDLDSDNDTLSDQEECLDGAPCPDLDQSGVPDFVEITSLVCPIPLVTPTVNQPSTICSADMLSLTVNESALYNAAYPGNTINYIWTNNNGVDIATTTNPTFDIVGNDPLLVFPLTVVVTVDVDCESSPSAPVNVQVNPTPEATPTANFENICLGGEVQLFAETVPGASYQWFFSGFPFSSAQNPVLNSLNQSTEFGLEVSLNGCTSTLNNIFITVDEPAIIEAMLGSGEYCTGEDVIFTAINTNPNLQGNLTYTLTGPDGLMVDVVAPAKVIIH